MQKTSQRLTNPAVRRVPQSGQLEILRSTDRLRKHRSTKIPQRPWSRLFEVRSPLYLLTDIALITPTPPLYIELVGSVEATTIERGNSVQSREPAYSNL
ncbi:hypothetical protein Agabi119p4_1679 [Agaricus bisporus var. burnettii]|uniref:Uncharacterized protein n=1 Tax=Agaricus bisporus var. burnettii TaxID=192524 RepID=A0A8H7F7U6_AGABI|nr:hypothetical protein Agabi119p4_1679 [Agaricus bisporus var. burnettii]